MVLPPIRESFFRSDKEATPVINDESTSGTAISFNKLIKIFPNGAIQLLVKSPHPCDAEITPNMSPSVKPIIIFQCNSSFIISLC